MEPISRSQISSSKVRAIPKDDGQQRLMRGLVNGMILSFIVWIAAGYLAVVLR